MVIYAYYPVDPRTRREVEILRENGAHVHVICLRNNNENKHEKRDSVNVHRIPMKKRKSEGKGYLMYFFTYLAFLFLSTVLLALLFIKNRYNVVHVHSMPDHLVFCTLFPKLFGAKIILDLHELTPEVFVAKFDISGDSRKKAVAESIEKKSLNYADLVITTNNRRKDILVQRTGKQDVIVVMNLPKNEIFAERDMADFIEENQLGSSFIVFYVGGLNPQRELDVALKAIGYAQDRIPNIRFIFGGSGEEDYIAFLHNEIRDLDIEDKVLYLGFIPQEDILNYVILSNVTISTYKPNPNADLALPTKVFEYMVVPKPVILADLPYMSEELGSLVLLYESGDYKSLGDRIVNIYENEDNAVKRAEDSKKLLFEKYNIEGNEKDLVENYNMLIA
jgi:glycosyltransferase involved in cell wall biosynthesis